MKLMGLSQYILFFSNTFCLRGSVAFYMLTEATGEWRPLPFFWTLFVAIWRDSLVKGSVRRQAFTCKGQYKGTYTPTVESSPIQSSQTHKDAAVTLWLTYNGSRSSAYTPPAESSRVESSRVESSRVPRAWPSQSLAVSCLHLRQSCSSERCDVCYLRWEIEFHSFS